MDDSTSEAPPHSWKGLIRGFVLLLAVAAGGTFFAVSLLKSRPLDLREQTASIAEDVNKIFDANGFSANRVERISEGQKSSDEAVWHGYRYRVSLPADRVTEDVRHMLATGLATRGVAVEPDKETGGFKLVLLGCVFAHVELGAVNPNAAALPSEEVVEEVTPVSPLPALGGEATPLFPEAAPSEAVTPETPVAVANQTPALEAPHDGYSPLMPLKPEPGASEPAPAPVPAPVQPQPGAPEPAAPQVQPSVEAPAAQSAGSRPKIAIIVDDGGYGGEVSDAVLALDPGLTLSILPRTPRAKELAQKAQAAGFEVMLHMPMEAEEGGESTLTPLRVTLSPEEIAAQTEKAVEDVPGAVGVNNHEGSKFTGDAKAMTAFLEVVKAHSLYFIDSRTSPLTLAGSTAQALGIRTADRDVFLDNDPADEQVRAQFAELLSLARKNGTAIGICHFRMPTTRVLADLLKGLSEREGVDLVHVSQVLP